MLVNLKKLLQVTFLCVSMCVLNVHSMYTQSMAKDLHDLSFVTDYNVNHPTTQKVLLPFLKQCASDLDDQITFKYHYINELHPDSEAYEAFNMGKVDFGTIRPGRVREFMPLSSISSLPSLVPNAVVGSLLAQDIIKKFPELREELPTNSEVLAVWTSASYELHSVKPIKSLADLKGKKVAVWQEFTGDLVEQFGASAVLINTADTGNVLKSGEVDAVIAPFVALEALNVYDVATNHLIINAGVSTFVLSCYKPLWDQFSKDVQRYLKSVSGAVFSYDIAKSLEDVTYDDMKGMQKNNHSFFELSDADKKTLEELSLSAQKKWLESMPEEKKAIAQEILDYTLERAAYYKKEFATGVRR